MIASLGGFFTVLNLGIGKSLAKHVAELRADRDVAAIRTLFQTALAVALLAGGVIGGAVVAGRHSIAATFLHGEPAVETVAVFAVVIGGSTFLVSAVLDVFSNLAMGLQRFRILNSISILIVTVWQLGSVAALALGYSVKTVLVLSVGGSLTGILAYAFAFLRVGPGVHE